MNPRKGFFLNSHSVCTYNVHVLQYTDLWVYNSDVAYPGMGNELKTLKKNNGKILLNWRNYTRYTLYMYMYVPVFASVAP